MGTWITCYHFDGEYRPKNSLLQQESWKILITFVLDLFRWLCLQSTASINGCETPFFLHNPFFFLYYSTTCKRRVNAMSKQCENPACSHQNATDPQLGYDLSIDLSDYSGTLTNCRLLSTVLEAMLGYSVSYSTLWNGFKTFS